MSLSVLYAQEIATIDLPILSRSRRLFGFASTTRDTIGVVMRSPSFGFTASWYQRYPDGKYHLAEQLETNPHAARIARILRRRMSAHGVVRLH